MSYRTPLVDVLLGEILADRIAEEGITANVGRLVPGDWSKTSTPFLLVAWDGTPRSDRPVVAHASIRVVAFAATPSAALTLASTAEGLLVGHGTDEIPRIQSLIGVSPAVDPQAGHHIAWFTVRATTRLVAI